MAYVHQKCIRTWIEKQLASSESKKAHCEICKSPLFFKSEKISSCDCKFDNLQEISCCNIVSAFVEIFLIIITILVYQNSQQINESTFLRYVVLFLIGVLVLVFILTVIAMISEAFFRTTKHIRKIYSIKECEELGLRERKFCSAREIRIQSKRIKSRRVHSSVMVIASSAVPMNPNDSQL
jgi:hypothetical protein